MPFNSADTMAETKPKEKKRKTHSNKGAVYIQDRDWRVMRWIIEQTAVSVPHLQILLARFAPNREVCDLLKRYNLTAIEADEAFALNRLVKYSKLYNSTHGTLKLMVESFRLPLPKA